MNNLLILLLFFSSNYFAINGFYGNYIKLKELYSSGLAYESIATDKEWCKPVSIKKDSTKVSNRSIGVMVGSGLIIHDDQPGRLLFQLGITGSKNNFRYELSHILQPYSEFGVKNRYMILGGYKKDVKQTTEFNFMAGIGYYHSTKNNSYIENAPHSRKFYPGGLRLIGKLAWQHRITKKEKWVIGLSVYFSNDSYYYQHHRTQVPTANINGMFNLIYRWK